MQPIDTTAAAFVAGLVTSLHGNEFYQRNSRYCPPRLPLIPAPIPSPRGEG